MKRKPLAESEIGQLISKGKNFTVSTKKERALCLYAARFAGVKVTSRKDGQSFKIFFL